MSSQSITKRKERGGEGEETGRRVNQNQGGKERASERGRRNYDGTYGDMNGGGVPRDLENGVVVKERHRDRLGKSHRDTYEEGVEEEISAEQ